MTAPIFRRVRLPAGDERAISAAGHGWVAAPPAGAGARRVLPEVSHAAMARGRDDVIAVSQRAAADLSGALVLQVQLTGLRWQARMGSAADFAGVALLDCACLGVVAGHDEQSRERWSWVALAGPQAAAGRIPPASRLLMTWPWVRDTAGVSGISVRQRHVQLRHVPGTHQRDAVRPPGRAPGQRHATFHRESR